MKGIDVSTWQGSIDFSKVKQSGMDFVIIRAGYGKLTSQKDARFEENYKRAKAAGLDVGVYWYSYADSVDAAKKEAEACLTVIKGKTFEYPIYFDLEEQKQFAKGKDFCDSIVKAFCSTIEDAGYFAGLYISRSPLTTHISDAVAKRYALWIAEYNSQCNYSGTYGMWQYSSKGKVAGISGNVDLDQAYIDYPSIIKAGGYNGYNSRQTAKKNVEELADEVLSGVWGNGEERKKKLLAAGYDYEAVQKRVNEKSKTAKKTIDEIAHEVLRGDWGNGAERKKKLSDAGYDYAKVQARVNELMK